MALVSDDQIQAMVNTIVEKFHPQAVYLFGSYARGEATEDSDLDFLIEKRGLLNRRQEMTAVRRVLPHSIAIDVLVCEEDHVRRWEKVPGSIFYNIREERKQLYGK